MRYYTVYNITLLPDGRHYERHLAYAVRIFFHTGTDSTDKICHWLVNSSGKPFEDIISAIKGMSVYNTALVVVPGEIDDGNEHVVYQLKHLLRLIPFYQMYLKMAINHILVYHT